MIIDSDSTQKIHKDLLLTPFRQKYPKAPSNSEVFIWWSSFFVITMNLTCLSRFKINDEEQKCLLSSISIYLMSVLMFLPAMTITSKMRQRAVKIKHHKEATIFICAEQGETAD
jgi:hypothetical protein